MCWLRDDLVCLDGACAQLASDGSECRTGTACASGYCRTDANTGDGVWGGLATSGPCINDQGCALGFQCARQTNQCEARRTAGAECLEDRDCEGNHCGLDGLCRSEPSIEQCNLELFRLPSLPLASGLP